jgi:SAM-dependent methyltransferase
MESRNPNINYVLLDGPPEVRRCVSSTSSCQSLSLTYFASLTGQYVFMKAVIDLPSFLPSTIEASKIHRVLDAAAGTAAWALDLADQPYAGSLQIYASDLSLSKFPPAHILDAANIFTFRHDLTRALPEEMKGTFDLVHMSYLVYALTSDQWKLVLKNLYDALGAFSSFLMFIFLSRS